MFKNINKSIKEESFPNSTTQLFYEVCFGRISSRLYEILSMFSVLLSSDVRVTISVYLFKFSDLRDIGFFILVCLLYSLRILSTRYVDIVMTHLLHYKAFWKIDFKNLHNSIRQKDLKLEKIFM